MKSLIKSYYTWAYIAFFILCAYSLFLSREIPPNKASFTCSALLKIVNNGVALSEGNFHITYFLHDKIAVRIEGIIKENNIESSVNRIIYMNYTRDREIILFKTYKIIVSSMDTASDSLRHFLPDFYLKLNYEGSMYMHKTKSGVLIATGQVPSLACQIE